MEPWCLNIPFVKYISAPRGSGKTYLLINLLIHDKLYKNKFDKIYFFCPSFYSDSKYSVIDIPSNQVFTEYKEEYIEKIIQDKKIETEILLIFDDCITQDSFKKNTSSNILNTIAVNGRHMHISMIITSQKCTGSSSYIRSQADGVIVFKSRSLAEIDALYNDNSIGTLNSKEFRNLIDYCTNDKYGFLYINYQQNTIYKNFKQIKLNKN